MAGSKTLDLTIRIAGRMDKSLLAAISGTQSRVSDLARSVSRVGTMGLAAMGTLAAGTVAVIANCTNAATDFENQMADVVKYVGGIADADGKISDQIAGNGNTYAQNYAEMKKSILDLSTQIPYTAEDLTRLAAAAGQSGKEMDEITGEFLKDAAMWGKAMDISADQAGDWAAKWEVAFKMNHDQIMTLADQINYLGANNATTAAEIAQVVNDAASLGQVAGIDPDATAAIGTAVLAMGVDASKVATSVKRIYTNVSKGSSATKAMKSQWEELGFTAEGVAKSMQEDGVGTMQKIFQAIDQLPEERQVAALSTLFGQWAIEGGAKIVGNLKYYSDVMDSVTNPANYKGSMERELQIKMDTPEAIKLMRDNAWNQLKIGFGENFLPVQKEIDTAMRDLFVRLNENMPQLSQLGGTLAELAGGGIQKLGDALEAALPYVQRALDYVSNNGPQVVKLLGGMAGTFAAMKFAPGITGLAGGAGDLLLGKKSGAGNYAVRTGGLAGMLSGLWKGGQNAGTAAAGLASGAAGAGKTNGVRSTFSILASSLLSGNGIQGTSQLLNIAGDSPGMLSGYHGLGGVIRETITGSRAGQYAGNVGASLGNFLNTTGIAGAARGAAGAGGQILSGIAQATGLTDLVNGGVDLARTGAGKVVGGARTLANTVVNSAPVQAVSGFAGRVATSAPVQGMANVARGAAGWIGNSAASGAGALASMWGPMASGFGGLLSGALPIVGAVSSIIAVVSILGDHLEGIRGIISNVFGDAGVVVFDSFIDKLQGIGDFITGLFADGGVANALLPLRQSITEMFGVDAGAAFGGLQQILQSVMSIVGQVVTFANTTVKPIIQEIFSFVTGTVMPVILQTFTAAAPVISGIISSLGTAIMTVAQIIGTAIQTALPAIENLIAVVMSIASVVIPALLAGYETFSAGLANIVLSIQGIFQGILDFVTGVFTGNWSLAWDGVKQIFANAFSALGELIKTPLNAVISIVNKAISGINGLSLNIPEWVPVVGGKNFSISIPEIPMLAKGGFTAGPSIAGEAGTEAVISFQKSERSKNIDTWMQAGKMLGVTDSSAAVWRGNAETDRVWPLDVNIAQSVGALTNAGSRAMELPDIPAGAGGSPSISINFAPQITIRGNADRGTVEQALEESEQRFQSWIEANFERFYNRAEKERSRRAYA